MWLRTANGPIDVRIDSANARISSGARGGFGQPRERR